MFILPIELPKDKVKDRLVNLKDIIIINALKVNRLSYSSYIVIIDDEELTSLGETKEELATR